MRWCLLLLVLVFPATAQASVDANPGTLTFSWDVTDGASPAQTSVVTNNTGAADLVSVTPPSNADFQVLSDQLSDCSAQIGLFNGESCNVRVRYDPSSTGHAPADSVVVTVGSESGTVNLDGTGTFRQLTPSPTSIAFGQQSIGAGPTGAQDATLTNSGTGPVTFTGAAAISGPDADQFQVASSDCTGTLAPTESCTVHVTFDPSSFGDKTAHVSVPSNAPAAQVDLTGTGIQAQLSRSPDTLGFTQDVNAGPSAPQVATITNAGSEPVPISSVAISDPSQFAQLTGNSGDCVPNATVPVGGTCEVRIVFDPSTKGPKSATVTVNSSAPPLSIALDGTATLLALDVPATLDLGELQVGVGKTSLESSTVANTGTEPVTLSSIRLRDPDTARFLLASGLSGDCAAGRTLAAGDTCSLRVLYAPQSDGTKTGSITVNSTAGVKTLLVTAAATPGLRIPAFSVRASRTQNRRMTVIVSPLGGTVSNVVVRIRSSSGAVVGSGTLTRASSEHGVAVRLRSALRRGRYVASASGRDQFAGIVIAPTRGFSVR